MHAHHDKQIKYAIVHSLKCSRRLISAIGEVKEYFGKSAGKSHRGDRFVTGTFL